MRISDWSSDVCSSDLAPQDHTLGPRALRGRCGTCAGGGAVGRVRMGQHLHRRNDVDAVARPVLLSADAQHAAGAVRGGDGVRAFPAGAAGAEPVAHQPSPRSEEHTSELQSRMRISYAVFCLKKKDKTK